jgi:hypothetical protein
MKKDAAAMNKSNKPGASVQSEYETSVEALRAKTAKLKALRMARDAAAPPPAPKRKAKSKAKSKTPSGSLSDWLDGRAKEGHRS